MSDKMIDISLAVTTVLIFVGGIYLTITWAIK